MGNLFSRKFISDSNFWDFYKYGDNVWDYEKFVNTAGVYIVVGNNSKTVKYIGATTKKIKERIEQHYKDDDKKISKTDIIYYAPIRCNCTGDKISDYEQKLIEEYKPSKNKSNGGEGIDKKIKCEGYKS